MGAQSSLLGKERERVKEKERDVQRSREEGREGGTGVKKRKKTESRITMTVEYSLTNVPGRFL